MLVRVLHEGFLKLSMMNPWAFSTTLTAMGWTGSQCRDLASRAQGYQGGVFLPTLGLLAHKESQGGRRVLPFFGLAGQLNEFV
jgi:hypothetical protein